MARIERNTRSNARNNQPAQDPQLDTSRSVSYLQHAFSKATRKFGYNNSKGTDLYKYQVEFAYLLDEVMRAAPPMSQKAIVDANQLIESIEKLPS